MDELTRNLALMENVAASDALNNAQAILEEAAGSVWPERVESEQWLQILRYVVPTLQAEQERRRAEHRRLRRAS